MAAKSKFTGTGVALITPFLSDGSVDKDQLRNLTVRLISEGVEYLVALGTTSESPTLSKAEKLEIVNIIKDVNNGRVPLVVGAGGNNTAEVISWIGEVGSEGIDAYLSVVPYYNKPGQSAIYEHFKAIAEASELPLILYNVPGRTGSNMQAQTTLKLAIDLGNKIAAVKEASGDMTQIMTLLKDRPEGFLVLSGDDALALPMIAMGAEGVISVLGNALPGIFSDMIRNALNEDLSEARKMHYKLFPFVEAIFKEGNPTGVKALIQVLGDGDDNLRLPLLKATDTLKSELRTLLKTL